MGTFDYLLADRTPDTTPKTPKNASPDSGTPLFGGFGDFVNETGNCLADDQCERAAITEFDAGVPREWADGYASLQCKRRPEGFSELQWLTAIDDGGRFLDSFGPQAATLGWQAKDVFGLDPRAPAGRLDAMGLVFLLGGRRVQLITASTARICEASGNVLTFTRRPLGEGVPVWDLLDRRQNPQNPQKGIGKRSEAATQHLGGDNNSSQMSKSEKEGR